MPRNYLVTYIAEFLALASSLLVYRLAAVQLGTTGFAEYMLATRTASVFFPLLLLGVGVGIPRYVAYAEANGGRSSFDNFLVGGLASVALVMGLTLPFALIFATPFSRLFFGRAGYEHLIGAAIVVLVGQVFHGLAYSYFRGRLKMIEANLLQLLNSALIPPIAFLVFGQTAETVMLASGLFTAAVSLVFLVSLIPTARVNLQMLRPNTIELLKYGVGRVPGDFVLAALYTLPATYVAHTAGVERAGMVAFAVSLLTKVAYMFTPIGVILLPEASRYIARNEVVQLRRRTFQVVLIAAVLTIAIVVVFLVFGDWLLEIYLGPNFGRIAHLARITMLGALPLVLFFVLRSIIDAYYVQPVNARNLLVALGVLILLMGGGLLLKKSSEESGAFFQVIAFTVLGVLTIVEVQTILSKLQPSAELSAPPLSQ